MVPVTGFHHQFCRIINLVGGDLVQVGELLDGEEGLLLSYTCGIIVELVEVYEGLEYREEKGGWYRVVGYVSAMGVWGVGSPIRGISARRALWSPYYVCIAVVVVGSGWLASVGMRINQWFWGVLVGVYVGVSGSPKCVRCVSVRRSARGL